MRQTAHDLAAWPRAPACCCGCHAQRSPGAMRHPRQMRTGEFILTRTATHHAAGHTRGRRSIRPNPSRPPALVTRTYGSNVCGNPNVSIAASTARRVPLSRSARPGLIRSPPCVGCCGLYGMMTGRRPCGRVPTSGRRRAAGPARCQCGASRPRRRDHRIHPGPDQQRPVPAPEQASTRPGRPGPRRSRPARPAVRTRPPDTARWRRSRLAAPLSLRGLGPKRAHSALPPAMAWPGRALGAQSHSDLTRSVPVKKCARTEREAGNGRA